MILERLKDVPKNAVELSSTEYNESILDTIVARIEAIRESDNLTDKHKMFSDCIELIMLYSFRTGLKLDGILKDLNENKNEGSFFGIKKED